MKNFILKLAIFILPILALAYPIDLFVSRTLKKSTVFAEKEFSIWNDILEGRINSDIVIYGSSRAWVHISPKIIMDSLNISTYNLGIDGHNFWMQNLRHKLLLKYNKKPKLIIHSVDVFTLQKRKDFYNSEQVLPYMLFDFDFYNSLKSFEGYKAADFALPLMRYTGKTEAIKEVFKLIFSKQNTQINHRIRGYQGREASWNNDLEKAKKNGERYTVIFDSATIEEFHKYLKSLKKEKIRIFLVYTPEQIDGQSYVVNRKAVIDTFTYFCSKYKIPFYDFSKDDLCYDKKNFYNASHLNKKGSEIFTTNLVQNIRSNYK